MFVNIMTGNKAVFATQIASSFAISFKKHLLWCKSCITVLGSYRNTYN